MFSVLVFFIIIYFFIYYISKKLISANKEEILMKSGFSNIQKVYEDETAIYYSAIKSGDNYLVSCMKEYLPSMNSVNLLAKEMKDRHYHKGILICISVPQQSLIEYGKKNSIEAISIMEAVHSFKIGMKNEEYRVEEIKEENPIQEPKKSYFKDLFRKPDRL